MSARALLLEITHCPVVVGCKAGLPRKCSRIVAVQPGDLEHYQVPEPWSGHIDAAPILFLSSNPSLGDTESGHQEEYPRWDWSDERRQDFFENRFANGLKSWIEEGKRPLMVDGEHGAVTKYWTWAKNRAIEILGPAVQPGLDYALAELVRCKSRSEEGVSSAMEECVPRYLDRTLALSGACLVVPVGRKARLEVAQRYGGSTGFAVTGPIEVAGQKRMIAPLGAPAGPEKKTFSTAYPNAPEVIATIRRFIDEIRAAKASHLVNDVVDDDGRPFPPGRMLEER